MEKAPEHEQHVGRPSRRTRSNTSRWGPPTATAPCRCEKLTLIAVRVQRTPPPSCPARFAAVDRFPRVRLGHAPTPLDPAPSLGAALGIELWIKRDDCTGLAFGGNKVRQLEFHFGEAQARGADTVLATGAVQSNLVRVAAAGARRLGLDAHVQLEDPRGRRRPSLPEFGQPAARPAARCDAARVPRRRGRGAAADAALERLAGALAAARVAGRTSFTPPPGHPPLGGLGYVVAAEELMTQAAALGVGFDAVVCASGSALTHAGVLVGLRALGETTPVYGICVRRRRPPAKRSRGAGGGRAGGDDRAPRRRFDACDIAVTDQMHPPGYGRLNDAVRDATALAARHEALLLDPVYTGKAMAGLVAHVRSGRIAAGSRVLFIHTGGLPALFAYADKLGNWLSKAPWTPAG